MTDNSEPQSHVSTTGSAASDAWRQFADSLASAGTAIFAEEGVGRSPAQQSELAESMVYGLIAGLLSFVNEDRDHPQILPLFNSRMPRYAANADTVYLHALINGEGSYRITGRRGTATMLCIQLIHADMGFSRISEDEVGPQLIVPSASDESADDLEIIVSSERPDGYAGLWMELNPEIAKQFISVRYVSKDWATEIDPQLAIEPLHCSIRKQRTDPTEVFDRLQKVPQYLQGVIDELMTIMRTQLASGGENNQWFDVTHLLPTISGQSYSHGVIEIGPNEAWVAEVDAQEGMTYWSAQLLDYAYSTLDSTTRQCAVNSDIGDVDPDGKIRIVVSDRDPGVVNWLDKSGYEKVQIRGRWLGVPPPDIRSRVVPFDELINLLPADVERIGPNDREARLRERSRGAQMRRLW